MESAALYKACLKLTEEHELSALVAEAMKRALKDRDEAAMAWDLMPWTA